MSVVRATGLAVRVSPSDLQDALSDFQSKLGIEDRVEFDKQVPVPGSPPDAAAVINLVTILDQANRERKGRCFASRLHVILESINQFSLVVSTFVSSNPATAALVWGSVQFTLVLVSRSLSRFERISELLMEIGRESPRFESYQRIFPDSVRLQNALCTYYARIIKICTNLYLDMRQPEPLWKELYLNPLSLFTSRSLLEQNEVRALAHNVTKEVELADVRSRYDERKSRRALSARKREREKRDERLNLMNKLSSYDYKTSLAQLQGKRCNNTVEWLDDDDVFKKWRTSPESSILWFMAKLGGGKSVTMAHAISLLYLHHAKQKSRITYIFCRFDDQATRSATLVLRCLIRQCLDEETMPSDIGQLLKDCLNGKTSDLEVLQDLLLRVISIGSCHFVIVDGLDDMDETEQRTLCEALLYVCEKTVQTFKVVLSCRHHAPSRLRGRKVEVIEYALPPALVKMDIEAYVDFALTTKVENRDLSTGDLELIALIARTLLDGAEEMFLWVELMLLEICSQPTDDDIREMLYKPPPTLTELYAQVLSRIDAIGRSKEATTAFKLIAVARRPLTALELQEAMAVEPFARASQPGRFINNFSQIFIWLGGLVIREEINNEVRFAHSTVLQAISDQRRIGSQQWAHIDVEQADVDVGVICTTYLHFDDFKTQLVKRSGLQNINSKTMLNASLQGTMPLLAKFLQSMPSRRISRPELSHGVANKFVDATTYGADVSGVADPGLRHHPFLEYASAHWLSHSRQFASTDRIWPFWKSLLSDDHELAKLPLDLKQNGAALSRGVVHEWHFALLLWDQLGRKLIPVDKIRSIMSTACKVRATLFLKSFFRHWAKLALNPDMITTILTEIVEMRDMDLARIVINSQFADTTMRLWNDRSNTDDSLLREHCTLIFHSATIADDVEQIKKLAMCGVNITRIVFKMNYISRGGWNPLSTAASLGNIAAVRYLLGLRVCVNTNQHLRRTALQAAAENGHVEVVRLLLSSGADINAAPTNYRGRTALQAAAGRGHTYIVELLLLAGAHVQAAPATIGGRTALQAAADSGHVEVIKLLCPSRADINAAPCKVYGRTALQAAAEGGHAKVVAKLLAKGAEVNAEPASEYGRTALQAAAGGGYAGIVTKLLLVGAHVNAKPARDGGRTALQAAAEYGDLEVVEVLLSAGANVNATTASDDGCTALRAAAQSGHAEIVKRLLSAGADPNAAPFGCTELQAAKERGHKEIVDLLLAAGAY